MSVKLIQSNGSVDLKTPVIITGSGGNVDLTNYYTKSEVDNLIPDVSEFVTLAEVQELEGIILTEVEEYCSEFVTAEYVDNTVGNIEIPDVSLFVTGAYVQTAINESLPDLAPYAKTEDIPDVSAFQTEEQVKAIVNAQLGVIENGSY